MTGSLYWLTDALPGLVWFACVYLFLGLPAAWLSLARVQWRDRALVGTLAIAFAPALLTAWMFILGSLGAATNMPLLRPVPMLLGLVVMAAMLWWGVWRKWRQSTDEATGAWHAMPLRGSDNNRILFGLIFLLLAVAVFLRWITTAYWPFTAYDTLWVYGYQGRLYALKGLIPSTIGYYPPFMALQYASAQILFGINDHAARMTIPFLHIGGILAAYVLGRTLFGKRAGWAAAALWGLYPHVGAWAQMGDLEIPLAFFFTLAAALFLQAWRDAAQQVNRRAALLAGAVLGIALWTKPTAGAFVWGVGLLVGVEFFRVIVLQMGMTRHAPTGGWDVFKRRFMTAFYTGLACAPLGGTWYVRNVLLGHAPVDFPPASWLSKATRSGDLFGWLLIGLLLLLILSVVRRRPPRETLILAIGTALIILGTVPSMPWFDSTRLDPPMSTITLGEAALIIAGTLILVGLLVYRWSYLTAAARETWATLGWALLLALPYFITWFFSYSYHYRLSFAIVPLMMLPAAALLGGGGESMASEQAVDINESRVSPSRRLPTLLRNALVGLIVIVLAVPGITATITEAAREDDWLWVDRYPDDIARYKEHVPEMILLRDTLEAFKRDNQKTPVIVAPGEQRLPFFYPELTIVTDTVPTRLDELAGFTHYIYGTQPEWRYQDEHIAPEDNQIVAALGRKDVMLNTMSYDDGIFRYEVYEPHLEMRQTRAAAYDYLIAPPNQVVYDDTIEWTGYAFSNAQFGNNIVYDMSFRVVAPATRDLMLRLFLVHIDSQEIVYTTETCLAPGRYGCYRAKFWEAGEVIVMSGKLIDDVAAANFPRGEYTLRVAFVEDDRPVTAMVDGSAQAVYDLPGFRN